MALAPPVRLAAGKHRSPVHGVCVMELAATLAGEAFSDRPRCVDPVVAAYMRGLNDRLGDHSRQRLEPYARLAVGTRTDRASTRVRRDRCLAFAAGTAGRPRLARLRLLVALGVRAAAAPNWGAAAWALRALDRRGVEPAGFPLLEELLRREPPAAHPPARSARPEPAEPRDGDVWCPASVGASGVPSRDLCLPASSPVDEGPVGGE